MGLLVPERAVVCIDESTLDGIEKATRTEGGPRWGQPSAAWQALWRVRPETPAVAGHQVSAEPAAEREGDGTGSGGRARWGHFWLQIWDTSASPGSMAHGQKLSLARLRAKATRWYIPSAGRGVRRIVWLGAYRADRAKHAGLVTFRQGTMRRYITNVRDPHTFPIRSIAEVPRRWDIEMALKLVDLKLHLLWSSKQVVTSSRYGQRS